MKTPNLVLLSAWALFAPAIAVALPQWTAKNEPVENWAEVSFKDADGRSYVLNCRRSTCDSATGKDGEYSNLYVKTAVGGSAQKTEGDKTKGVIEYTTEMSNFRLILGKKLHVIRGNKSYPAAISPRGSLNSSSFVRVYPPKKNADDAGGLQPKIDTHSQVKTKNVKESASSGSSLILTDEELRVLSISERHDYAEALKAVDAAPSGNSEARKMLLDVMRDRVKARLDPELASKYDKAIKSPDRIMAIKRILTPSSVERSKKIIRKQAASAGANAATNLTMDEKAMLTPTELTRYKEMKAVESSSAEEGPKTKRALEKMTQEYRSLADSRKPYTQPANRERFAKLETWQKERFCGGQTASLFALSDEGGRIDFNSDGHSAMKALIAIDAKKPIGTGVRKTEENKWDAQDACAGLKKSLALAKTPPAKSKTAAAPIPIPVLNPTVTTNSDAPEDPSGIKPGEPNKNWNKDLAEKTALGAAIGLVLGSMSGGLIPGAAIGALVFYAWRRFC